MNKTQLIDALAARFEGNRKAAAEALEAVLDTITREVARGEKVAITGFGSFEKRIRESRWVRNPATGEKLKAPTTAIPKFTAGADLKSVVAGLRELPQLALDTATAAIPGAKKPAKKPAGTSSSSSTSAAPAAPAEKPAPATRTAAKKTTAKKAPAKKTSTAAKKTTATKTAAKKSTAAKKTSAAKKTTAKKAPAKKASS